MIINLGGSGIYIIIMIMINHCDKCNKRYYNHWNLQRHIASHLRKEKKVSCQNILIFYIARTALGFSMSDGLINVKLSHPL